MYTLQILVWEERTTFTGVICDHSIGVMCVYTYMLCVCFKKEICAEMCDFFLHQNNCLMEHPSQVFRMHSYMYQAWWQEPYHTDCTSAEHSTRIPPTAPTKHTHRQKDPKCKGQGQSLPSPSRPNYYLKICLLPRPPCPGLILSSSEPWASGKLLGSSSGQKSGTGSL